MKVQRTEIFSIALMPLDYKLVEHERMLRTIYRTVTDSKDTSLPRFGSHWEDIGFQDNDPSKHIYIYIYIYILFKTIEVIRAIRAVRAFLYLGFTLREQ